jgi:hypothetical protein
MSGATHLSWAYDAMADVYVPMVAWHPDIFVLWDRDDDENVYNENDPGRAGGWVRVGVLCSAQRRSMWMRVWYRRSADTTEGSGPARIELCAGREGGDSYLCIERDDSRFAEWHDLLTTLLFARDT